MRGHPDDNSVPEFPEIEEKLGYNPARWLHTHSPSGQATGIGQTPELATAYAIIKGITNPKEIAHWLHVETRTRDRDHVKQKLEQRRRAIKHDRDGFLKERATDSTSAERAATDGGETPPREDGGA